MKETEFVEFLKKKFPFSRGVGIGDDTSAVKSNDQYQLITTDMLIENIHFRLKDISLGELAAKALAVNQSDIASMGGQPEYFYLNLGFPGKLGTDALKSFFQGLARASEKSDLQMAGGDFSRSPVLVIAITMVGTTPHPVFRHTAKPGDLIGVTGPIGASALGCLLLQGGKDDPSWTQAHNRVIPRIREGQILSRYVNAMIDVSDGLVLDLKRILKASGTGAILEYGKIPIPAGMREKCRDLDIDEKELVLSGGEDYVLLFSITPEKESKLRKETLLYHLIGHMTPNTAELVIKDQGTIIQSKKEGFDHFLSR